MIIVKAILLIDIVTVVVVVSFAMPIAHISVCTYLQL
jgi:hypothetical protein